MFVSSSEIESYVEVIQQLEEERHSLQRKVSRLEAQLQQERSAEEDTHHQAAALRDKVKLVSRRQDCNL